MIGGDPKEVAERVRKAIREGARGDVLLYEVLKKSGFVAKLVKRFIKQYKPVLEVLNSPEGRRWLKDNVDCVLDYLLQLAEA